MATTHCKYCQTEIWSGWWGLDGTHDPMACQAILFQKLEDSRELSAAYKADRDEALKKCNEFRLYSDSLHKWVQKKVVKFTTRKVE
jgi:hypothetical protein